MATTAQTVLRYVKKNRRQLISMTAFPRKPFKHLVENRDIIKCNHLVSILAIISIYNQSQAKIIFPFQVCRLETFSWDRWEACPGV